MDAVAAGVAVHLLADLRMLDGADNDQDWIVAAVATMAAELAFQVTGGPETERWFRRAVDIRLRLHGPNWADTVLARQGLAMVLMDLQDYPGIEAELRAVAASIARSVGADHLNAVGARHDHAIALLELGDLAGADASRTLAARHRDRHGGIPRHSRRGGSRPQSAALDHRERV
ncbi:hypothetical protein [Kutzneria chonburiensis]|uniref:Uncharacterized protein n=1 Tax=Kutzneria chonburiensis TaxID=1483604 RepID=A0ABV6MRG0_9PSEU|nr:hypothetical protein [Kutzneria chonburiensis]